MGLYLEQVTKYINQCLEPLGCISVTGSMIRNYVKMDLVANPVKKQYYATHIQHLIPITILKSVVSMEHLKLMFDRQAKTYPDEIAYDYFCEELERLVSLRFEKTENLKEGGVTSSDEKIMLNNAISAVSHVIYLNACFKAIEAHYPADNPKAGNAKKAPK